MTSTSLICQTRGAIDGALLTGLQTLRRPVPQRLSEWAERHFYLSTESSYVEGPWRCLSYQRELMDLMSNDDVREIWVLKGARVGYALATDTPIPTPSGWITMGDLAEGDEVFDEQGRPCRVRYKSPVYRDHKCYRVKFCDGSTIVADAGHLWLVDSELPIERVRGEIDARSGRQPGGKRLNYTGIVSTDQIAQYVNWRGRSNFAVRNAGALHCADAPLPIPPYTLGMWLGDGHRVTPRITQHRPDADEVARYIRAEGVPAEVEYIDDRYAGNATIFLAPGEAGGRRKSSMASDFRALGLVDQKHIPARYMRASAGQRLELLRGLMDSDGTIGSNGRAEFNNTNKALVDGVYELLVSLGYKATIRRRLANRRNHLDQWRVNFKARPECNPFKLSRKASLVGDLEKPGITLRRRIVAVDAIDPVPVQCIQVTSASSLFLAGASMLPTHNTKMIMAAAQYMAAHKRRNGAIWQPTDADRDEFVKTEIEPAIRDNPELIRIFPAFEKKSKHNTLALKQFVGAALHLRGGKAAKNYRRLTVDYVMIDELDGFDGNIEGEGPPHQLAARRVKGANFPKAIYGSTPHTKGLSMIEDGEERCDIRVRWHVPCPECDHYQEVRWGGKDTQGGVKWQGDTIAEAATTAAYECESCGHHMSHQDYARIAPKRGRWMTEDKAIWIERGRFHDADGPLDEQPRTVGVKIWAGMNEMLPWSEIVREWLTVKGDKKLLQGFVNLTLAEAWEEDGVEQLDHQIMHRTRREHYDWEVPDGVNVLTLGIDVQDDRFEAGWVGWGEGEEAWNVDYRILQGDLAQPIVWEQIKRLIRQTEFRKSDGEIMRPTLAVIDHGGHYSKEVEQLSKALGVMFLMPAKGLSVYGRPIVTVPKKRTANGVYLLQVGTDTAKNLAYQRLQIEDPGPGYIHWPRTDAFDEDYFKQFTAEKRVPKWTGGVKRYVWDAEKRRNETWDVFLLNLVAVQVLQQRFGLALDKPAEPRPMNDEPGKKTLAELAQELNDG